MAKTARQGDAAKRYTVLIVDDQRDARLMLRAGLETLELDMGVIDVPSGEEAMLVLSKQRIDLLVVDVRLPGMSGLELKQRASIKNPDTRLILITGVSDPEIQRQVAEAGASAYFYKPVAILDFLEAVQSCLEGIPPRKAVAPEEPPAQIPPRETLSDALVGFCREVNAVGALVFDSSGAIQAQSGDWPLPALPKDLIPIMLETLRNGNRILSLLGSEQEQDLYSFKGSEYDLFLSHLPQQSGLLFGIRSGLESAQIGRVIENLRGFISRLPAEQFVLVEPGSADSSGAPVAEVESETLDPLQDVPYDPSMDDLLRQVDAVRLKEDEVDAFWDSLAEGSGARLDIPAGEITYEEARKMGLAPESPEEEQ